MATCCLLRPRTICTLPWHRLLQACHDRECYLQDRLTGQFLVHGELIVDVLYHKPQISVRLATHAESARPDAVQEQQA